MARSFSDRFGGAALITGASAGIGEAFAEALAARGMSLVLVARRRERLEALARRMEETHGVQTLVVAQDLAEPDAAERLGSAVEEAGVTVGLLVNNAGYGGYGAFEERDPSFDARMVDLNCRAPVLLTHRFLPSMLERGRGGLIFLSSIASYQPTPWFAVYGATKAFDLMFAEALWAELGPKGIEVLALSPGYTPTEFQRVAGSADMKRPGGESTPEEVVEAALRCLGRRPSVVPGAFNRSLSLAVRVAPRALVASIARRVSDPGRSRGGD